MEIPWQRPERLGHGWRRSWVAGGYVCSPVLSQTARVFWRQAFPRDVPLPSPSHSSFVNIQNMPWNLGHAQRTVLAVSREGHVMWQQVCWSQEPRFWSQPFSRLAECLQARRCLSAPSVPAGGSLHFSQAQTFYSPTEELWETLKSIIEDRCQVRKNVNLNTKFEGSVLHFLLTTPSSFWRTIFGQNWWSLTWMIELVSLLSF